MSCHYKFVNVLYVSTKIIVSILSKLLLYPVVDPNSLFLYPIPDFTAWKSYPSQWHIPIHTYTHAYVHTYMFSIWSLIQDIV